jgi:exopolysaccharide production protein ExoZ
MTSSPAYQANLVSKDTDASPAALPAHGKLASIQALRGIAILLVVLRHMKVYEDRYSPDQLLPAFSVVGDAGVDLFFAVSGFVMMITTGSRFGRAGAVKDFLYKRAARIYPLYWIFSLVILPLYLLRPEMVNSSRHGLPIDLPSSFLLWPQAYMPLLGQGWTLVHEMYFYAVFSLALFWAAGRSSLYFAVWSALLVAAGFANFANPELLTIPVWKLVTHPLTFEFIGGVVIARLFVNGKDRFALPALALGAVLMLAASFMNPIDADPSWRRRAVLYGIPALLVLYGTVSAERRYAFRFPRLLLYVGDISYSVYLTHILVLVSIGRIWSKFHSAGMLDNVAVLSLMMTMAVVVGSVSYRFLETPMQEFFSNIRSRVLQPAGASN